MPWVRIDDSFYEHPKFAKAGPLGIALWLSGLAYCNRNLTDGFIPWAVAHRLVNWEYLDEPDMTGQRRIYQVGITCGMSGDDVDCQYVAGRLVLAGLWEEVDGGYLVHDYGDYQPSREEVLRDRARTAERQERYRRNVLLSSEPSNAHSNAVTDGPTNRDVTASVTTPPYPVPVPNNSDGSHVSVGKRARAPKRAVAAGAAHTQEHAKREIWEAIAARGWTSPVTRGERAKWASGCLDLASVGVTPQEAGQLADEYASRWPTFERSPKAIANNLTSLRAPRKSQQNGARPEPHYMDDAEAKAAAEAAIEQGKRYYHA